MMQPQLKCFRLINISSIYLIILTVICFKPALLFSQELEPKKLIDIYHQAEMKHPLLLKAKIKRNIAGERLKRAKAKAFLPTLDLNTNITNSNTNTSLQNNDLIIDGIVVNTTGLGGRDQHVSAGYSITLTQPLFHKDRLITKSQATLNIERANLEIETLHQNLILKITNLYFDTLSAINSLRFSQAQKLNLHLQLKQSKQRFEVGEIAIMNVNEAEAGYARAIANEFKMKQLLENAKTALQEATGSHYVPLPELCGEMTLKLPEPNDPKLWADQAETSNPRIAFEKVTIDLASKEKLKKESDNSPQFDIVASSNYLRPYGQDSRFFPANTTNHSIGVRMTLNLYEGGQKASRAKEAFFELESAQASLTEKRRAIVRQTSIAFSGVVSGVSIVPALRKTVDAQKASVETIRLSVQAGRRTALDLVLAEEELFRAQRDYAKARYEYLLNSMRLKHAVGILTESALIEIDSLLSDSKHKCGIQ